MAATLNVVLGSSWTLVYDAAVSGDFTGAIGTLGSGDVQVLATTGSSAPVSTDQGVVLPESYGFTDVALSKAYGDRLYAKLTTGSASLQMAKRFGSGGLPAGLFEGMRAMFVQSYTEGNVKNGAQWEFASTRTTLAASGVTTSSFRVGGLPVLIKTREIKYTGKGITAKLYEDGASSGGTQLAIHNMRRATPVPSVLSATFAGVTVGTLGTECGAPTVGIGSTGVGQSTAGAFAVQGVERWLKPNTVYHLQITNDSTTDPTDISVYVTFYEGYPDLPIPQ